MKVSVIDIICILFDILMKNYSKYFALSDFDKDWGLHVIDYGVISISDEDSNNLLKHPNEYRFSWEKGRTLSEYQLIYLVQGEGIFESSEVSSKTLKPGSLIMIHPEVWHRYKPVGSTWNTYWFGFNGKFAKSLVEKVGLTVDQPVKHIGYNNNIIDSYINLMDTGQVEFTGYQQVISGDVLKIFGWIFASRKRIRFQNIEIDRTIQRAKTLLVDNNFTNSMEDVAEELQIGYSKFRKIFKEYTGLAPGEFQIQHKIRNATNYLIDNQLSIKEIAFKLNFDSPQYFYRIFKKKMGITPGKFRSKNRKP